MKHRSLNASPEPERTGCPVQRGFDNDALDKPGRICKQCCTWKPLAAFREHDNMCKQCKFNKRYVAGSIEEAQILEDMK